MRKTSNYKRYESGGAVLAETTLAPEATIAIDTDSPKAAAAADASVALQKQVEALRQSEQAAKDRAAPETRADIVKRWKANGLSDAQEAFLNQNLHMADVPHLLEAATAYARHRGHAEDSPDFFEAVKTYHDKHMSPPEPEFEPPSRSSRDYSTDSDAPVRASIVSAPVSRTVPGGYSDSSRSNKVTLSAEEKDIANRMGMSLNDYAAGKLDMQQRKERGEFDR
jgi:hypothetical protein